MAKDFDLILDECIDRLNKGETLETCLADYPEYAGRLEPLLKTISGTQKAYSVLPSASAKRTARKNFQAALDKLAPRPSFFSRISVWATAAAAILLLVIGYFAFRPDITPPLSGTPLPSPVPDPAGNFVFLISDDVNAIDRFSSVNVSISKIGVSGQGGWTEFVPQINEVDLTLLPGDKTQQIWRGNLPEGDYNKVFIYVNQVHGILKSTGESVEIKLPSQKIQISKSFRVSRDIVTSFIFDLTVIATGNDNNPRYILKPQAAESGPGQPADSTKVKGKKSF